MGIRVNYDIPAGPAAAAGYAAGFGLFKQKQNDRALDQQNRDRAFAFQAREAQADRAFRREQAAIDNQQQAVAFNQSMALRGFEAQSDAVARQQALQQRGQAFEFEMAERQQAAEREQQEAIRNGLKDGSLRYTASQTQKMNQLYSDRSKIMEDMTLRPRDRERAIAQVDQQLKTLMPRPVLDHERPQTLDDLIKSRTRLLDPNDPNSPIIIQNSKGDIEIHERRNVGGGKAQVPPGTIIKDPTTGKPVKFADEFGGMHSVGKDEEGAKRAAEEKAAAAAQEKQAKAILTQAQQRFNQELSDLKAQKHFLAPAEKNELWRSIYSATQQEMSQPETEEDGTPKMPTEVEYPKGVQERMDSEKKKLESKEATEQRKAAEKEIRDRYEAVRDRVEALNERAANKGKKAEDVAITLPEYEAIGPQGAIEVMRKYGINFEQEQPQQAAPESPPQGQPQQGGWGDAAAAAGGAAAPEQQPAAPSPENVRAVGSALKARGFTTLREALNSGDPEVVQQAQWLIQAMQAGQQPQQ